MSDNSTKTDRIRHLNDLARTNPLQANATWMFTSGVRDLIDAEGAGTAFIRLGALRRVIAGYCDWRKGNDPYREHDFGAFDLFGERLFFKVDYYHPDRDVHAPDAASIELCRRVLTVMLASEY